MAGKNRKAVEKFIIDYVEKILPGGGNREAYEKLFVSMNDEAFDDWMKKLKDGTIRLSILAPNQSDKKISVERNLQLADELGHKFFERLWMDGKAGSAPYLSVPVYLVLDLPLRRQAQLLLKKITIPDSINSVDNLSGQPVGPSKGAKISYPELQILASKNLDNMTLEFIKYRGGDKQGFIAMNDSIARTGKVYLGSIEHLASGVESTKTLYTYLVCMHLSNSLTQK